MRNTRELLERIQYFKLDRKLNDLGIYSRQYLSNVLFWKYSAINKHLQKNDFAVIFGDFNKLSEINSKYSNLAGDEAIHTAMSIIKETLPAHAKIARVAGDEIIMIIEGISQEDADQYINSINAKLNSPINGPYNLTITLAASHSSEKNGIENMYEDAESHVSNSKLISKQADLSDDKIGILKSKISKDFENYFSLFRFSEEFTLSIKELRSIMKRTLNSIISVIEQDEISTMEQTPLELKGTTVNKTRAKFIDDELDKNDPDLMELTNPMLTEILDLLLREPVSGQYSRRFIEDYESSFLDKNPDVNNQYNAIHFSTSFLKLSNSISGHIKTDNDIREICNNLMQHLNEYIPFSIPLDDQELKNVFLDVGGADFLVLYEKNVDIAPEKINSIVQEVNTNSQTLKVSSYMSKEPISIEYISDFIKEASLNSKKIKDRMKETKIPTDDSQKALDLLLSDCLNYYKNNFKTAHYISHDTFNGKVTFMNLMFEELVKSAFNVFYPNKNMEYDSSINNLTHFPKEASNNRKPNNTDKSFDEMIR